MATEADKHTITEESGSDSASSSVRGLGRTPKLLAILAFLTACETGEMSRNAADTTTSGVHGEVSSTLNENSVFEQIKVMADKKGIQLFGNIGDANEPVEIALKLLGEDGEVLETKNQQIGPGPFNVSWNFATTEGHKLEMSDKSGKGYVYNLDAGSTIVPPPPSHP